MKRSSSTCIKRSFSCMDLAGLECEATEMHPRKRISQIRYRSLSAADLARKARLDTWVSELYENQPSDDLTSLLGGFEPTTTNMKDAGLQLELLDFWQHPWLHDAATPEATPRLC
ncbi:hypothetical protein ACHHYP_06870 [Achlya hypogyna]|uniref:Uncharacterized protein n=1 Tax=Achlya hypogyna TaxID=1202772 RepID=A0A1V9YRD0_ACHHY|nr:hypothetical protein ACHHYP_06870 [Achlya hypogyna]